MKFLIFLISLLITQLAVHSQDLGTKVRFKDKNGITLTGTINQIDGDWFRIKVDSQDTLILVNKTEFTVINDYHQNSRVDIYNEDGSFQGRGTVKGIISAEKFRIQFDGCVDVDTNIFVVDYLNPTPTIENSDPSLKSIFGKWQLLAYNYPENFTGLVNKGTSPPLVINADGTYTWYDGYEQPPIINNWIPYAKVKGVKEGPNALNSIILTDKTSLYWIVYVDKAGMLQASRLCSKEARTAQRIK